MSETGIVERDQFAVTERGKKMQRTEAEVDAILKTLASCGGNCKDAAKILDEEGLDIGWEALQGWRDRSFPHRYMQLRADMGREVAEKIAGNAMERALQADEAEQAYIAEAVKKLSEVDPNHLAKNALALANAKGKNIEGAQLLRDRPTEIRKVDLTESIAVLERLGVVEKREEIDAEVIEEEDV